MNSDDDHEGVRLSQKLSSDFIARWFRTRVWRMKVRGVLGEALSRQRLLEKKLADSSR